MSIGEGLGGWSGNKGMRKQIKKESVGMFTKRKIMVGDVQDHILEAARRMDDIGDDFGSAIVKFPRGKDYQIEGGVDYGTSIASLGPLGKPLLYLNDNVTEGVRSVTEPGSRKSVYNIPLGMSAIGKERFATTDQVRIFKGPSTGTLKDETLKVSVQPTHVYMIKQKAEPFNIDVNSTVREQMKISAKAPSYSNSMLKQTAEPFNIDVPNTVREQMKISAKAPSYSNSMLKQTAEPFNVDVPSSVREQMNISAKAPSYSNSMLKQTAEPFNVDVPSSVREQMNISANAVYSDSLNYVPHSYTENSIKLQNPQPKSTFIPANQIEKDNRTKVESYTLKNQRLSLSGFEVKAPYYLKH
jgi:hypothetical protein